MAENYHTLNLPRKYAEKDGYLFIVSEKNTLKIYFDLPSAQKHKHIFSVKKSKDTEEIKIPSRLIPKFAEKITIKEKTNFVEFNFGQ